MTDETTTSRTRRAVLAGGVGAAAAVAVNALASPGRALAADPNDVVLGATNTSTMPTVIQNTTNGATVLSATSSGVGIAVDGRSTSGEGVHGESVNLYGVRAISTAAAGLYGSSTSGSGVFGFSSSGPGVSGSSSSAAGVFGESIDGIGVVGTTADAAQPAILGRGAGGSTGVQGWSGAAAAPAPKPKTGVYGEASQDTSSRGVWGYSPAGHGVRGEATTGRGVHGQATSGIGVRGFANSGVGLSGEASTGYALRTKGRVRLDQSAGLATIASGTNNVVVTPGIDLTSTSALVATLNGDAGGSVAVKRVAINATANTFTIYLTGNAASTVKAAWIVLG